MSGLSVVRTPEQPGATADTSLYCTWYLVLWSSLMPAWPNRWLPAAPGLPPSSLLPPTCPSLKPKHCSGPASPLLPGPPLVFLIGRPENAGTVVVTTCDVTTGLRRGEDCGSNYAVSGRGRAGTPLCDVWAAPCRGDRVQHAPSQAKLHGRLAR